MGELILIRRGRDRARSAAVDAQVSNFAGWRVVHEPPFGAAMGGMFGMIASYGDHVECERPDAALVANFACLARLAAWQLGVDREKLLAGVAQSIRQWA